MNRLLATADTVMKRRGKVLTLAQEVAYRAIAAAHRRAAPTTVLPLRRTA